MRWLRRFFSSDDSVIQLVSDLLEPEAEMWRELLSNNGIRAFTKIRDPIALSEGRATGIDCALFVRRIDLERARELLKPLVKERQGSSRRHGPRRFRQRR